MARANKIDIINTIHPTGIGSIMNFSKLVKLNPSIMNRIVLFLLLATTNVLSAQTYDLVIRNGKIVDGTGNSWYYGDVGIWDGKIYKIGNLSKAKAVRELDANGQVVAPGFIDVHAHIEGDELETPTADNFVFDGVTTVVTGNCGGSNVSMSGYFNRLDSVGMSINVASLIGHNSVRRAVMGDAQRDPNTEEQARMEQLVQKASTQNIQQVIFDRNIYRYHGMVKKISNLASQKGLKH